jgi:DNA polymerase I-like protein with 3'-5' exonuclease and polymerase domains
MFPNLLKYDRIALDTETTGVVQGRDKAFGVSITTPDLQDFYWDIRAQPQVVDWLNDQMAKFKGTVIGHNINFDYRMCKAAGIHLPIDQLDDTVIRAAIIDEHLMSYSLDDLAKKYLGESKDDTIYEKMAAIFGGRATRKVQMQRISEAPIDIVAPYAKRDTNLTMRLWQWQQREIEEQDLHEIHAFERSLLPTFIRATERGIRVDVNYAEQAMENLTPIIKEKQAKLDKIAGFSVNVNSSPQIRKIFEPKEEKIGGQVMWIASDGTVLNRTNSGNPSIDSEALREMKHPAASLILEIRSLLKTRDTFLGKHVIGHEVNGRVFPTINQTKGETGGTGTGRLSYQDPAMQQIPSRNKEVAAIVKPCFLPEEGQVWVDGDMNSFEVRVFAHLINNPTINEEYKRKPDTDLHEFVGQLTGLPRNASYSGQANAKQLNLSMIFNSGNGAIAEKMGMDWKWESFTTRTGEEVVYKKAGDEAIEVIERYHRRVPGVRELAEKMKIRAQNWNFIRNYKGRKLRFPRGYKAYKASGILIQSTSAELNKENWKLIEDALGDDGYLLLNTHDSYSMSMPEDWAPIWKRVKEAVETPRLRVPLLLDLNGVGSDWWQAVKKED